MGQEQTGARGKEPDKEKWRGRAARRTCASTAGAHPPLVRRRTLRSVARQSIKADQALLCRDCVQIAADLSVHPTLELILVGPSKP